MEATGFYLLLPNDGTAEDRREEYHHGIHEKRGRE
jgi:hypothetical protein